MSRDDAMPSVRLDVSTGALIAVDEHGVPKISPEWQRKQLAAMMLGHLIRNKSAEMWESLRSPFNHAEPYWKEELTKQAYLHADELIKQGESQP